MKIKRGILIILLSNIFTLFILSANAQDIISSERIIDWQAGIPGGIPDRTAICANVIEDKYGAKADGVADDTSAIQNAINNCSDGQVVYIPAGVYNITRTLSIFQKGIVLRGEGIGKTILKQYGATSGIRIYSWGSSTKANILSGYEKDSTQITLNDSSAFNSGEYIIIDQLNDPSLVSISAYSGTNCTWCGRENGNRTMSQIVKITAKEGNLLTINRPLYYSFNISLIPQVLKLSSNPVVNAGVENLTIENMAQGSGASTISLTGCVHCWIRDVEGIRASANHVKLLKTYGSEIRDSYFHHGFVYTGGSSYGIWFFGQSSDNLAVNNILYYLRHGINLEGGGSGNVIAYNYVSRMFDEKYPNTDWLMADLNTHGAHPYMNLFEGNIATRIGLDSVWGSSSHNTFLRNYILRQSEGEAKNVTHFLVSAEIAARNYYGNLIGNVLGTYPCEGVAEQYPRNLSPRIWMIGVETSTAAPNTVTDLKTGETILRHGNIYCTDNSINWDPNISSQNVPDSLFYDSKPDWFGDLAWPPFGPGTNYSNNTIPAQIRYKQMVNPQSAPFIPENGSAINSTFNGNGSEVTDPDLSSGNSGAAGGGGGRGSSGGGSYVDSSDSLANNPPENISTDIRPGFGTNEEKELTPKEIEKIIEEENIKEAFNTEKASYAKVILYGFLGMVFFAIVIVGFLIVKILKI